MRSAPRVNFPNCIVSVGLYHSYCLFLVVLVGDYEEVQASIDNLEEMFGEIVEKVIISLQRSKIEGTEVQELTKMPVIEQSQHIMFLEEKI